MIYSSCQIVALRNEVHAAAKEFSHTFRMGLRLQQRLCRLTEDECGYRRRWWGYKWRLDVLFWFWRICNSHAIKISLEMTCRFFNLFTFFSLLLPLINGWLSFLCRSTFVSCRFGTTLMSVILTLECKMFRCKMQFFWKIAFYPPDPCTIVMQKGTALNSLCIISRISSTRHKYGTLTSS